MGTPGSARGKIGPGRRSLLRAALLFPLDAEGDCQRHVGVGGPLPPVGPCTPESVRGGLPVSAQKNPLPQSPIY